MNQSKRDPELYAFGELLWDLLPAGRHAGGAPFNVCAHAAQLGAHAALVSAVGRDEAGDAILRVAEARKVDTRFVRRAKSPTGTVQVDLDPHSNATYRITTPAAWEEIDVTDEAVAAVAKSRVVVFGSLAAHSSHNQAQLERLLVVAGPLKLYDVNLRPPLTGHGLAIQLARHAHVLKLNEHELAALFGWLGGAAARPPQSGADIDAQCAALAEATGTRKICVTRGALGAVFWDSGVLSEVSAPPTIVRDTVGAGDGFTAGLALGLMRELEPRRMLHNACLIGAFVAAHDGATPTLSDSLQSAMLS